MKAVKLPILFLFLVLIFIACKKEPDYPKPKVIHYAGQVVDKNNNPISNVTIYIGEEQDQVVTDEPIKDFIKHNTTLKTFTDSFGRFSIDFLDPHPKSPVEDHHLYNYLNRNIIYFSKEGFLANKCMDEYNVNTDFGIITMHKSAYVKLILNPVSPADGITIYGNEFPHPFYTSNLYARADQGCRVDSPRYAVFKYTLKADINIKFKWHIYTGGGCWGGEDHEKTIRTNPDNKDTLVFKIDY